MLDILQSIIPSGQSSVLVGTVVSRADGDKYLVTIAGVEAMATSSISDVLRPKMQVIINVADSIKYIIGVKKTIKDQQLMEIMIDG